MSKGRPIEEGRPGEERRPIEEGRPGEERRPIEEGRPGEERRPIEEGRPGEERRPIEEGRPGEERRPIEEGRPGEERRPIEGERRQDREEEVVQAQRDISVPIDEEQHEREQSEQRAEAAKIATSLCKVLASASCHETMSTLFTEKLNKIAKQMHEEKLITHDLDEKLTYDAIITSFESTLKFMLNKEQLENHCDKFLSCIKNMKEGNDQKKWEQLAYAIKKKWEQTSPGFKLEENLETNLDESQHD